MAELINGLLGLLAVVGISYGIARYEIKRQLGSDYRAFIEACRYREPVNRD